MEQVKFTPVANKGLGYPIGYHIAHNKREINALKKVMKETIGVNRHITLWCMGSSGAIVAGIVSLGFRKVTINHVKKYGESSHSKRDYDFQNSTINIIIDDFSNTGNTLNAIYQDMEGRTVDYVCTVGHMSLPRLSFIPKAVIARNAYLDRAENKEVKYPCLIQKIKSSDNFKVVNEQPETGPVENSLSLALAGAYKVKMNKPNE